MGGTRGGTRVVLWVVLSVVQVWYYGDTMGGTRDGAGGGISGPKVLFR